MEILILDNPKNYPNLNLLKSKLENSYEDSLVKYFDISKEDLANYTSDQDVYIFSYNVDLVIRFLDTIPGIRPIFEVIRKRDFKELYEDLKNKSSNCFVPKLKLSVDKPVDLLEVSNLFRVSESKCLKHINGTSIPQVIKYEGIETLKLVESLTSGVLVPATDHDLRSLENPSDSVSENENIICQLNASEDKINFISYSVRYNNSYQIVWTDVNQLDSSKEDSLNKILHFVKDNENSIQDQSMYLVLEKHNGEYFISRVNQGIHPFVTELSF